MNYIILRMPILNLKLALLTILVALTCTIDHTRCRETQVHIPVIPLLLQPGHQFSIWGFNLRKTLKVEVFRGGGNKMHSSLHLQ